MHSHPRSKSRTLSAVAWLAVGLGVGVLLGQGPEWIKERENQRPDPNKSIREIDEIPGETRSPRTKRNSPDARISITPEQLSKLASGGAPGLSLRLLVGAANGYSFWGTLPEEKRDENLKLHLEDLCSLLSFTADEAAKLREILKAHVQKLMDLETTSLPVRQPRPGTLELDFDALLEDRELIMTDLRRHLREAFGERALQDLDILAGLDDFTGKPGESQNVEWIFEPQEDGWKVWCITPGPGGRKGDFSTFKGASSYPEVVQSSLRLHQRGRFAHLKNRVPADLAPPP